MGVVYKAYDNVMQREVAIKVIHDAALSIPQVRERFYREARTAGRLAHENIATIYDIGEEDQRPYIVMEYLPGEDLGALIDEQYPFTLAQKLNLAAQIARGIAFSHSHDVIHRDIKPANVRIVDKRKVKILDFGIAKPESSTLTVTSAIIGTPYYMSPEQVRGHTVDKRSDIFSFGILLFEFLTYLKPFSGNEITTVMYKIVHEEAEHREDLEKLRLPELRHIVMRLLQKDPERRYQNLDVVADELAALAAKPGPSDKSRHEEERRRTEQLLAETRTFITQMRVETARQKPDSTASLDSPSRQVIALREQQHVHVSDLVLTARKHQTTQNYPGAIMAAREILASEPTNSEGWEILESATAKILDGMLADAQLAFEEGDSAKAETIARDVLKQQPGNARASALLQNIAEAAKRALEPQLFPESVATDRTLVDMPAPRTSASRPAQSVAGMHLMGIVQRSRIWLYAALGGIGLVGVGVVLFLVLSRSSSNRSPEESAATPLTGIVALNVLPWGEVTRVEHESEGDIPVGAHTITPCRLSLPGGRYRIHVRNPAFTQLLVLEVDISPGEVREVRGKMPGFDYTMILSEF